MPWKLGAQGQVWHLEDASKEEAPRHNVVQIELL